MRMKSNPWWVSTEALPKRPKFLPKSFMIWKIKNEFLKLDQPLLMGILNLTPDSFSDGSKWLDPKKAVEHAFQMKEEGAGILDLGAESTRPGAHPVSEEEELSRMLPVLKELVARQISIPISIDTTKPQVARICLEAGAQIINDVSGLKNSGQAMADVIRESGAGVVLMHRRGTPETMQSLANYDDVVTDVLREIRESVEFALASGISAEQIVIDPGLGFAKATRHTIRILNELERFQELGFPVLVGHSRKSFIGENTGRGINEREAGTAAVSTLALLKGAKILRVHDIRSTKDAVRIFENIQTPVIASDRRERSNLRDCFVGLRPPRND
jgi:dihydropteroate synthase